MEEGLDTGPVAREARTPIRAGDTAGDLTRVLAASGARLLAECWGDFAGGRLVFHAQRQEGIVYARKIDKSETPIDWTADARSVRNHIHGLSPSPGAYSEIRIGGAVERIKFLRVEAVEAHGPPGQVLDYELTVACGDGAIHAHEAQRAGKTPMSGVELVRGANLEIGARFMPVAAPSSGR
jgi:methionyl-tRNA formyltransferase